MQVIDKFIDAMRGEGLVPAKPSEIKETFGELKRYTVSGDNPKNPSGYYILSIEGDCGAGCFGSHKQGYTHKWHTKLNGRKLTKAEKDAFKQRLEKAQKQREAELKKVRAAAEKSTKSILSGSVPANPNHSYFQRKGIAPGNGMKEALGKILVPVWGTNGRKVGIQYIDEDGGKLFLKGTYMHGSFYPFGSKATSQSTIIICEGVATGATLHEATGKTVVCAFNSGNMLPVAKHFRDKYPDAEIIIAGDNDQWTVKQDRQEGVDKSKPGNDPQWTELRDVDALCNPGADAARVAAHAVGGYVCLPDIPDDDIKKRTDFNDLYLMSSIEAVSEQLSRVGDAVVASKLGLDEEGEAEVSPASDLAPSTKKNDWLDELAWMNREKGLLHGKKPLYNAIIWLREHPTWEGRFCYNEFTHKTIIISPLPWDNPDIFEPREVDNRDLTRLKAYLEKHGMNLPMSTIKDAIEVASERNTYNPVKEYFERIKWDGKKRLNTWLIDICGAREQDADYVRAVGSKWMIGAVSRVYRPGCKFDNMLVLQGKQGVRKSTALECLATFGKGHHESFFNDRFTFNQIDDKYAALHLLGYIIIEFQELSGMGKKDRDKIKQWITEKYDEVRKPFAATTEKYPRSFVLAGTTNETQWLTDPTGNRRFWPVTVGKIDIEKLEEIKEQLWAEAVRRYKEGEQTFISHDDPILEIVEQEQSDRYMGDVWEKMVADGIGSMFGDVTTEKILKDIIEMPKDRWTHKEKMRIGAVMRSLGYDYKKKRVGGKIIGVWEYQ